MAWPKLSENPYKKGTGRFGAWRLLHERGKGGAISPNPTEIAHECGISPNSVSTIWRNHFAAYFIGRLKVPDAPKRTDEDTTFHALERDARALLRQRLDIELHCVAVADGLRREGAKISDIRNALARTNANDLKSLSIMAGVLADKAAAVAQEQPLAVVHDHPSDLFESPSDGDYPPPPDNVVPFKVSNGD